MTYTLMGALSIVLLLALIFLKVPIGYSLGFIGFAGCTIVLSSATAGGLIAKEAFRTVASYSMTVVPLFILMGNFVALTGMGDDAYDVADKWSGRVHGNIPIATMIGCALFASVSGSALATAATFEPVSLPRMKERRYPDAFSTGVLAAGSTIGIMIPPSVILVYYGVLAETSVGDLFAAGFLPGILLTAMFCAYCFIYSWLKRGTIIRMEEKVPFLEKVKSLRHILALVCLFVIVIGGIYSGIVTPNEAAGVGCAISLLYALAKKRMTWKLLLEAMVDAVRTTVMLMFIMVGAKVFNYFLVLTDLPAIVSNAIISLPIGRFGILAVILLIYLFLGCFLDSYTMITLTLPFFLPVIVGMGYDPIWFGILMVIISSMGLMTPPLGLCCYVIDGMCDVPLFRIFKGCVPFLIIYVIFTFVLAIFPNIVMLLPNIM